MPFGRVTSRDHDGVEGNAGDDGTIRLKAADDAPGDPLTDTPGGCSGEAVATETPGVDEAPGVASGFGRCAYTVKSAVPSGVVMNS